MHETSFKVRWGELDPYNHVNHTVYLSYLEAARIEFLESIGWGMETLRDAGIHILVAEISVRFRRPAVAGDVVTVWTAVDEIRAASSSWRQTVVRADGTELVSARVLGAITGTDGRPQRIPDAFRTSLAATREDG